MIGLGHHLQIAWVIVVFVPVDVVDYFTTLQWSTQHLLCDNAVFVPSV